MFAVMLLGCVDPTTAPPSELLADDTGLPLDTGPPEPGTGGDEPEPTEPGTTPDDRHLPPIPSAGCGTSEVGGGAARERSMTSRGQQRTWWEQVPGAHDGVTPLPLVLDLHGTLETANGQRWLSGMDQVAREEGWVIAWPESQNVAGIKMWDITCDNADLDFLDELIDQLDGELCLDRRRLFVTGLSNGGYATHLATGALRHEMAAGAAIAGGLGAMPWLCRPRRPVPMLIVHGTADTIVPPSEGQDAWGWWTDHDRCPAARDDAQGCRLTSGCADDSGVRYCTPQGVGHLDVYAAYPTAERIREFFLAAVP